MNLSQLEEIINQLQKSPLSGLMSERTDSPIQAKEGEEQAVPPIKFPKFEISEMWGKKTGGEDRGIIEQLSESLKGDTVQEKVANLQSFLDAKTEEITAGEVSLNEVIANLMFLEVFASVVFKFNASVAGFLFEALFAGVFSGYQIEAAEADDPTDAVLNISGTDVDYSFKLLAPGGVVKGSFTDLVNMFTVTPEGASAPKNRIVYLVVEKVKVDEGLRLDFYEFEINKENWFDFIGHEQLEKTGATKVKTEQVPLVFTLADIEDSDLSDLGLKRVAAGVKIKSIHTRIALGEDPTAEPLEKGTILEPEQTYSTMVTREMTGAAAIKRSANFDKLYGSAADKLDLGEMDFYTYITKVNEKGEPDRNGRAPYQDDPKFFERLTALKSYGTGLGAGQFVILANHYKQRLSQDPVSLTLGRERLFNAATNYTQVIGKQVGDIFNALSALVGGVNGYFLSGDLDRRKQSGKAAVKKAEELRDTTDEYIKKQEAEEKADREKQQRANVQRRAAAETAPKQKFPESKQPIDLDKLIEQMINKKFN